MIETALETLAHQRFSTEAEYLLWAAQCVAKLQEMGVVRIGVHDIATPVLARIDFSRWLIDCECGAGVATHPDWTRARCGACGATYLDIRYPPNRLEIESILLERPQTTTRFWYPYETAEDLRKENTDRKLGRK